MVSDTAPPRDTAYRRPLLTVFLGWLWVMAGANLAAPLYAGYAARFGFSGIVVTTVFATYAVTLVATLLVCGRLADRVGRRPVILAGLAVAGVALVAFSLATATWWLYAARALQGVAVGLISGPATAALVELDPQRERARPAMFAGLAQAVGSGLGPLVGGCLAQWAPAPLHTCYLVGLCGTALAAGYALTLPERSPGQEPWRIQWPRVPDDIRPDFARLGLTAGLVWASLALYLSVVPSYVATLLSTDDLALLGANSALACFASAATQVWSRRRTSTSHGSGSDGRRLQAAGLLLLAAGLSLMVASALTQTLVTVLLGALVTGVGHGLGYLHAQDELNTIAPSERRAEVSAAFVCCIYVLVGGSVIGVGVLEQSRSLTSAVGVVAGLLVVGALGAAGWQGRRRTPVLADRKDSAGPGHDG
ncbi:MAG TPA: MFS transporter [Nocardioides sp.]|uniref:MFS transporter n=1 Tax=Nocardioides sp. TaxID=35761 RepID=UPI002E339C0F|nr:MFS transporter [Nocardioides sp.]HEX3932819.1 MFS transporter [Nocardioides sp.]